MELKKLKLMIDKANDLTNLLSLGNFKNSHITCNGVRFPVPIHLLAGWVKDLSDHLATLKKELIDAMKG